MRILAIDPGDVDSGYAVISMPNFELLEFGKIENGELLSKIKNGEYENCDSVAIEMIASYGMPVGKSVFETCVWIGRYLQVLGRGNYVYRKDEKIALCGNMKAKDSNIRQALIDRYAKFDYKAGKGTKSNKDTFYGVSKDAWSAIAVGVTYYEGLNDR